MSTDVSDYIATLEKSQQREDAMALVKLLEEESGYEARLGGKVIYCGLYNYKLANGKDGVGIVTGFLPRTADLSIYIMPGFAAYAEQLEVLGKHKSAKCCLYVKKARGPR